MSSGFFAPGIGQPGGVGGLSNFDLGAFNQAQGQTMAAMTNRYNQLGLGGSTMEAMDLGQAPSRTGGIPGIGQATIGEAQLNAAQQQPGGSGGKGTSPAGTIGAIGQLGGLFGI